MEKEWKSSTRQVFINNAYYVNVKDLIRFPIPEFIKKPTIIKKDYLIKLDKKEEIAYLKSRKDIIDYNSICNLTQNELSKMLKDYEEQITKIKLGRENNLIEKEKQSETYNELKKLIFIHDCLFSYMNHKKAIDFSMKFTELKYANQNYPREQLFQEDDNMHAIADSKVSVTDYVEDGFIEKYCLSDEEKGKIKKLRKVKKV